MKKTKAKRAAAPQAAFLTDAELADAEQRCVSADQMRVKWGIGAPGESALGRLVVEVRYWRAQHAVRFGKCSNFWHPGHGAVVHQRRDAAGDRAEVHKDFVHDSGCLNWVASEESEAPAAPLSRGREGKGR